MAYPRVRLWMMPRPTRLLATLYVASVLVAMAASVAYYARKTALDPEALRAYYQGSGPEGAEGPGGGLALHERKSDLELLQTLHPHSFSVPLMLFVLLHLYGLAVASSRLKAATCLAAFGSYALLFAAPWAAREGPAGTWLLVASAAALYGVVCASSLVVLWRLWVPGEDPWQTPGGDPESGGAA